MNKSRSQRGFTFVEVLVALLIATVGFLATSQMQYLALRQHNLADTGTLSTNLIQSISERDMAEVRRIHLLNSRVYMDSLSGKTITTQDDYCSTSTPPCVEGCPCNPLVIFTSNTDSDNTETTCAVIDKDNFDPANIQYETSKTACTDGELVIVRQVTTDIDTTVIPNTITLRITYAMKTKKQFGHYDFGDPLTNSTSVVVQEYSTTAHIGNWSTFVQGWTEVIVPHIP